MDFTDPVPRRASPDGWLLAAAIVVAGAAVLLPVALIGVVALLVWASVRLARRRPGAVALLTATVIVLASSLLAAIAVGIVTATAASTSPEGVTLIRG
ncbi:hypothetical protein [Leifsonia virtsii]|uniref:DUF4190 domain-containing protein n=1 Tax=Leifsonia virtsii TaxID=3035915 RepID=A0ABT8IV05_9MICO|nr:hypothetical protein [Leifsonia virtsii]MDN4596625.1 hypothetical protein [Leifsonia virtsii]